MANKNIFDVIALNQNRYAINKEEYQLVESITDSSQCPIELSIYAYLSKKCLELFLTLRRKRDIRKFIDNSIRNKKLKGVPRIIFKELMYTVTKYCKSLNMNIEQFGAVLSQFYLVHIFFTSSAEICPDKVYQYFKDLMFFHCLPFPPERLKLFNLEETQNIMEFFWKIYIKNLTIIKYLCVPNLGCQVNYKLPEQVMQITSPKKKKK